MKNETRTFIRLWRNFSARDASAKSDFRQDVPWAPSFYLSREHAWKQLLERRRRRIPPREKPHRSAMWAELEAALKRRLGEVPGEEPWVALDHVLTHYRPSRFFLSEDYALKLVRNIDRHRRQSRQSTETSTTHTDHL